jgi:crossover junction endodeoxyribonuclease RuvC
MSGAIAIHNEPPTNGWQVQDCPVFKITKGKSAKKTTSAGGIAAMLRKFQGMEVHAYIEHVWAGKGMGGTSMFSFGMNFGMWQMAMASLEIPYTLVRPQEWKKEMMKGMGKDKDASRARVVQLFPYLHEMVQRKCDDGRAEAVLIGEYGRRYVSAA